MPDPVPGKPVPIVDADSRPYWSAAAQGRLTLQRCRDCRRFVHYPRAVCPHCMSEDLGWEEVSGEGSIYTYTVVHRAPDAFVGDAPYVVALVELGEGVRLLSRLLGLPEHARIGARVRVSFVRVAPDIALPCFELVEAT